MDLDNLNNIEAIREHLEDLDAIAELEKARTQTRSLSPDELIALLRPLEGDIDSLNLTVASLVQAFETIDEELKQLDRDAEDVLKDQAKKIGTLMAKTTQLESCLKAQSERITALENAPKPFRLTRLKAAIALLVSVLIARPDLPVILWKSTTKLVHPSMHKASPQKKPTTKHKAIVEGNLPHHP
ncbi:hypothetical protein H6G17_08820 [Chroococcidiopsis sp. FACHB-1243]|uniref:hypothetical protein n=1 Tax=Chroococcidiopsis sp. [FACHB-1243] TaxID=2692781 RepID=UPI001783AC3D|nr:hypothetical protein [Chroococcidiopsis sp. [FACHB-1243]]MBD2305618.1 hypothetical protein [Chroococcidiopsis sp. [FACHB-1243]]